MSLYGLGQNRWSIFSGSFDVAGNRQHGLHSMDVSEEVKREIVRGNKQKGAGVTRGPHSVTCSAEILLVEWQQILEALGDGFSEVPFDINATYIEQNGDGRLSVVVRDVLIAKHQKKVSNDGKEIVISAEFTVVEPVQWNGLQIIEREDAFWEAAGLAIFG